MKFSAPKIVRFVYRYILMIILILIPSWIAWDALVSDRYIGGTGGLAVFIFGITMTLGGCVVIHLWFWEKFFAVLVLTDSEIRWICPLRKKRIIHLDNCVEIGAYTENVNNGIPSVQIYFSDHRFPQKNMSKNGVMKVSQHLIKFWYTKELSDFIMHNYPGNLTSCLNAYRRKIKQ